MWLLRDTDLICRLKSVAESRGQMQPGAGTRESRCRAFTLLEILVSIAVLTMMIFLLAQILNNTTEAWRLGESNTERLQNVRAINDFISGELQAALLPVNRSSTTSLHFVINPGNAPGITGTNYGNRDAIFWQAPLATDQRLGEVAEIGYFVHWDLTAKSSNPRASLCRFFVNPIQSGTSETPVTDPNFLIYTNPANWLSDTIIKNVVPAVDPSSSDSSNAYQGVFAENVIGLWVSCLDSGTTPIGLDANAQAFSSAFPSGAGFDSRRGYYDSTDPKHTTIKRLPAIVDLSFVIIDSNAAARITPTMQQAIVSLYSKAADGNSFVYMVQTDPMNRFQPIKSSLRSYQTRIYLQNSK